MPGAQRGAGAFLQTFGFGPQVVLSFLDDPDRFSGSGDAWAAICAGGLEANKPKTNQDCVVVADDLWGVPGQRLVAVLDGARPRGSRRS